METSTTNNSFKEFFCEEEQISRVMGRVRKKPREIFLRREKWQLHCYSYVLMRMIKRKWENDSRKEKAELLEQCLGKLEGTASRAQAG